MDATAFSFANAGSASLYIYELRDYLHRFFSTGVPLLDLMLGLLTIRLFAMLSEQQALWFQELKNVCVKLRDIFWASNRLKGYIECEIQTAGSAHMVYTTEYMAVMHRLAQIEDKRVWKIKEEKVNQCDYMSPVFYEVLQEKPIEVEPGVNVSYECAEIQKQEKRMNSVKSVTWKVRKVILSSMEKTAEELKEVLKRWRTSYEKHIQASLQNKQMLFKVQSVRSMERHSSDQGQQINAVEFHSHRNFDNFHFDNKEQILDEINFFLNHKEWYVKKGLPYSLGILVHGVPGCGKTSMIKALMNHTNRHAIVFSINEFTNLKFVERLMRTDTINQYNVPQDQRVYVFEDIDAMGDVVANRKDLDQSELAKKKRDEAKLKGLMNNMYLMMKGGIGPTNEECNYSYEDEEDSDKPEDKLKEVYRMWNKEPDSHLSFFLNLLDGVIESSGRIIIMTTNHLNKLDPALLRPGRMDIHLHFDRLTRVAVKRILQSFYALKPDHWQKEDLPEMITDKLLTAAELSQQCRASKRSYSRVIELLMEFAQRAKEPEEAGAKEYEENHASAKEAEEDPDSLEESTVATNTPVEWVEVASASEGT